MSPQGSPYARFRRALASRNATVALAAAAELPHLGLPDALALCLVLHDGDPGRYGRAAVRFAARYALELPRVDLPEAQLLLALLAAVGDGDAVGQALADVCAARGRGDLAEVVRRWRIDRGRVR